MENWKNIMTVLTLKDHIKGNCTFVRCENGNLWYRTETLLEFPVPMSDTHEAKFMPVEKGIYLMRWIRPYLKDLEDLEKNTSVSNVSNVLKLFDN